MRITQGTFSFLPDLTDERIAAQVRYALDHGWPISIEWTDDPHPRNSYWEMWGLPLFDVQDVETIMREVRACREAHQHEYVKVNAYDARLGRQTTALSFIVHRPSHEPGFRVDRQERADRRIAYTLHAYAAERPHGQRYQNGVVGDAGEAAR
jgi:ribulose-bisphosphate carboxylase small chain